MITMKLKLYINNTYYKTITVDDRPSGGYNSIRVINGIHEDLANGLLTEFEPVGDMSIRVEPVVE